MSNHGTESVRRNLFRITYADSDGQARGAEKSDVYHHRAAVLLPLLMPT